MKKNNEKFLTIDIGNSYIKMAVFGQNVELLEYSVFPTKLQSIKQITKTIESYKKLEIKQAILGSVVKDFDLIIQSIIKENLKIIPYKINQQTKFNFDQNGYVEKGIGHDLLALAQYSTLKNKNAIAFSFGTSSVGLFIKNNKLVGVSIAGGLDSSYETLVKKASLLNKIEIDKNSMLPYGTDNKECLESGYHHLRNGFALSFISSLEKELNIAQTFIVASGNAAGNFKNNYKINVDKYAILEGYLNILITNSK
ncbi:type III pantothenate kinase [Mycoplasmopsis alligatoris]|uniref:Type III pantothenate kinase n=1 Tax=Mycoplasmopsis alligatoris A21JP2 TaxID=747682 RepID=D4XWE8_9BACT|nr:type III pantothenate kinase [Mycoplasmopsis alligatoris]EFF41143.1 pantothenate kinase, type III [Mycoplasmopsis alligatoris A21JP2]